ncbi:MAG: transporter [Povalibacter sp.]
MATRIVEPSVLRLAALARFVILLFLGIPFVSSAQELEPRAYSNAPVGLNFLIAGYAYSEGGVVVDPSIPLDDAAINLHSELVAYARSFSLGGKSAKFDLVGAYASLSGTANFAGEPRQRDTSGWADPRLRIYVNLFGAPALTLPQMQTYQQDLIVGVSLQIGAPLGRYEADKLINLGSNRWSAKPEIGVTKAFGRWIAEFTAAAAFYSDNDNYFGGHERTQEPIYSAQGSMVYSFPSKMWVSFGATYYVGGRTSVDGVRGADLKENTRFGVTLAVPVNRRNSIKFHASTGVATRTGSDFDTAGIAWQYRWGGGV